MDNQILSRGRSLKLAVIVVAARLAASYCLRRRASMPLPRIDPEECEVSECNAAGLPLSFYAG